MHLSFFAHLPHLGPGGGDFKASRRNCKTFFREKIDVEYVRYEHLCLMEPVFVHFSPNLGICHTFPVH